ncbi:hypothetical protein PQE72_gp169 [Bacillus phage vB_BanS_Skywalker]|uniref:Uncharacterized protein n=2 Tax=Tsamsavirus TaxID=3044849 RepID=A0AAE8YYI4_9CAUD|nr:hypothetical protein PQE72_gp169 [Bacillus phage vB_BanS_Skywalker]YP_010681047.1 hypothetical protein PQE73_gp151 [Bacillus phage vB_BanS_MrDarsey]UGO47983.1 hypothetical protein MRDARSEY_151 [Bacillus phage vB_BanS_MrDarsey]UGO51274.1 hypothetical protein SKYWALKER_117 [Bacillus phage vB_BanS_Skywalker]
MKKIVWKITSVTDKNEVAVDNADVRQRMSKRYLMYVAVVGRSAILLNADNSREALQTSTVEELFLFEDSMKITTRNSVYWLKQSIEDVN